MVWPEVALRMMGSVRWKEQLGQMAQIVKTTHNASDRMALGHATAQMARGFHQCRLFTIC